MAVPTINQLLQVVVDRNASDLHLRVGQPPMLRLRGELEPVKGAPVIDAELMRRLVGGLMPADERTRMQETLRADKEIDFAYALPGQARFRVNVFLEQRRLSAALRRIPEEIPLPADIGLPPVMSKLAMLPRGLILVTGPTGSGKSTSLAALIRVINESRPASIITIEDPIEFTHAPARAVIRQRELGRDVLSFARGLRAALRQDPDVILIGEMRDRETIESALTAAETGHLVFSTLHTRSAESTIDRIIDVFEAGQQEQIRTQLSASLAAIMCQTLLPRADGQGRVAAHEVLVVNAPVRNLIRSGKAPQIRSTMQTHARDGMQTMDRALANMALSGAIDVELARERAMDPGELEKLLRSGAGASAPTGGQRGRGAGGPGVSMRAG